MWKSALLMVVIHPSDGRAAPRWYRYVGPPDLREQLLRLLRQEHGRSATRDRRFIRNSVFMYEFFFLIFFNLARGDIFSDCWVTSGVVLDKAIAAQLCTVVAFSQAPGQRNGYVGI